MLKAVPIALRAPLFFRQRALLLAFFAALLVKGAALGMLAQFDSPKLWENGMIAENIFHGKGFVGGLSSPDEATSWQAPGYPYVLAGLWFLLGQGPGAYVFLGILQALALASMVWPIHFLACRWFGKKSAIWAAWAAALWPLYLWYATRFHHSAFVFSAQPWLLAGWVSLGEQAGRRKGLLLGLATGLAGLFQPVLLAPFGLLGLCYLLGQMRIKSIRGITALLAAALGTILALLPWTLRNHHVHGHWVPIKTSLGKELWMGNHPQATGTGYAPGGREEVTNVNPPRAFDFRGKVSEWELNEMLKGEAWDYMRQDPGALVRRTWRKWIWFWTWTPPEFLRSYGGGEARKFGGAAKAFWIFLLAGAAWGAWQNRGIPRDYALILAVFACTYGLLYSLTHVGQVRFRGEIEYLLFPAFGMGLSSLRAWLRGRRTPLTY